MLSCLLLRCLRRLLGGLLRSLLGLGLLLCSQKRSILVWAIHGLANRAGRGVHRCLLLALNDHAAQVFGGQLPHCLGRQIRVLGPVMNLEFGKSLCYMLAQYSPRGSAWHGGHAQPGTRRRRQTSSVSRIERCHHRLCVGQECPLVEAVDHVAQRRG